MATPKYTPQQLEARRKIDRERKRAERAANTPYAQRVRESKRSDRVKARRRELRQREEIKVKDREAIRRYRQRPESKIKERARKQVHTAIKAGNLIRSEVCELCGAPDRIRRDGRHWLRADHYAGYDQPLTVRFVCPPCDGEQERQRGNTTLGQRLAVGSLPGLSLPLPPARQLELTEAE